MRLGLPAEIEVVWGSRVWHQRLEFYKIPFRCFGCRKIGHVQANCPSFRQLSSASHSSEFSTPKHLQPKWANLNPGDLNHTCSASEVWGHSAKMDDMAGFFSKFYEENELVDIAPVKMRPTWTNGRCGRDEVHKKTG